MFKKNMKFKITKLHFLLFCHTFFVFFLLFFIYIKHDLNSALSSFYGILTSLFSSLLFLFVFFFKNKKISVNFMIKKFYVAGFLKIFFLSFIVLFFILFGISNYLLYFLFLFFTQLYFWIFSILFFRGYSFL